MFFRTQLTQLALSLAFLFFPDFSSPHPTHSRALLRDIPESGMDEAQMQRIKEIFDGMKRPEPKEMVR